jgi:predicted ferric reductase
MVPGPLQQPILAGLDAPLVRDVRRLLGGYERWRLLHRTTGLFVAAGFAHGVLDATAFPAAPVLRWTTIAIGGTGLAFYAYREVLARFFVSLHDHQVAGVRPVADGVVEIALRPIGRPMRFVPGQFAMVYLEAKDGWHRHPFTISSAPHEDVVRVTVKALGDWTARIPDLVEPGMPAVIGGPHGRFDHRRGAARQAWIAAGVGVAPFLSWLRALDGDLREQVDLFVSSEGPSPFADEIRAVEARHPSLRAHFVDTRADSRLTAADVLAAVRAPARELSVHMCGPEPMLRRFTADLRRAGVRRTRIHREYFDWR